MKTLRNFGWKENDIAFVNGNLARFKRNWWVLRLGEIEKIEEAEVINHLVIKKDKYKIPDYCKPVEAWLRKVFPRVIRSRVSENNPTLTKMESLVFGKEYSLKIPRTNLEVAAGGIILQNCSEAWSNFMCKKKVAKYNIHILKGKELVGFIESEVLMEWIKKGMVDRSQNYIVKKESNAWDYSLSKKIVTLFKSNMDLTNQVIAEYQDSISGFGSDCEEF